jgi:hypothetical protein
MFHTAAVLSQSHISVSARSVVLMHTAYAASVDQHMTPSALCPYTVQRCTLSFPAHNTYIARQGSLSGSRHKLSKTGRRQSSTKRQSEYDVDSTRGSASLYDGSSGFSFTVIWHPEAGGSQSEGCAATSSFIGQQDELTSHTDGSVEEACPNEEGAVPSVWANEPMSIVYLLSSRMSMRTPSLLASTS